MTTALAAILAATLVSGKGAERPSGYVPPLVANGELSMTVDRDFAVRSVPSGAYSQGIFLAGRRVSHPRRELLPQGCWRKVLEVNGREPECLEWEQTLDVSNGTLTCRLRCRDLDFIGETFIPLSENTVAIRETVVSRSAQPLDVRFGVRFEPVPHERIVGSVSSDGLVWRYRSYGYRILDGETSLSAADESFTLAPGARRTIERFIVFSDSLRRNASGPRDFAALAAANVRAWTVFRGESAVELPEPALQRMWEMANYHLRINATPWSFPVGLLDSHWQGLYFGFDAMYMHQGLVASGHFATSRREPDYRFATLQKAIDRTAYGKRCRDYGARWHWEGLEDGLSEGTVPGEWQDHIFHMAAIAKCAWQQWLYGRDRAWFAEKGYPVLFEAARYFRRNWVYEDSNGDTYIGKCCDLERLGPARDRPFMTTVGAVYAMRAAAEASDLLGTNAVAAADFRACADGLVRSLPVRDGRYIACLNDPQESMATLAGFFPFPVFPPDHAPQREAVRHFIEKGRASGNMYPTGRNVCPWYAGTMSAAASWMGDRTEPVRWLREAAGAAGLFGEFFEINEPGVMHHPWFATAAGNCLFALDQMLLCDCEGKIRLAFTVPETWHDYAFRLPSQRGVTVDAAVRNGRLAKFAVTRRADGDGDVLVFTMRPAILEGIDPARFSLRPLSRAADRVDLAYDDGLPAVELPGEAMTNAPISCAPFPDRMSAYVWRNWFVVPHDRLARVVGATEADLARVAAEMGLPEKVDVLPEWRRKGYITVLRRNWHLLDYAQLLPLLDMSRQELRFGLMENDFLWVKMGRLKPKCGPLVWSAKEMARTSSGRRRIAEVLSAEGADDFSEEPRFQFAKDIAAVSPANGTRAAAKDGGSPFGLRLIFSYFADYADPLGDPDVGSYPEGLLQKLAAQGVNAVWLHTVLATLAKDPKYPEFGKGCEARMENLRTLVARAAKYGIRVYLYMNEPRAQPPSFFEANDGRRAMKGVTQPGDGTFTMCTSHPETLRWMRASVRSVFAAVPGLGGIFTITMSENHTNCASRKRKDGCPRCSRRTTASIVAEVNRTLVEGMREANPAAEAIVWNWGWPDEDVPEILAALPKDGCRLMAVSERGMKISRGGVPVTTGDYSISCVGPSDASRAFWQSARSRGLPVMAKVQANTTWEIASVPYLPVMDLVAEHASNVAKAGVDGVMLSWSLGCAPAPNLRVYDEIGADGDAEKVLNRLAAELYGPEAVSAVRTAWTSFSEGFRNYPFAINVAYCGPQHWGCANPLYWQKTGYRATMVGIPYDQVSGWAWPYPPAVWAELLQKVADGFEKGCAEWRLAIGKMSDPAKRAVAEREAGLFRAATLHFASGVDQYRFVQARDSGDILAQLEIADRECARAKEELALVRADSRIGYESSCQYFFVPQDLREKILSCRLPGRAVPFAR